MAYEARERRQPSRAVEWLRAGARLLDDGGANTLSRSCVLSPNMTQGRYPGRGSQWTTAEIGPDPGQQSRSTSESGCVMTWQPYFTC